MSCCPLCRPAVDMAKSSRLRISSFSERNKQRQAVCCSSHLVRAARDPCSPTLRNRCMIERVQQFIARLMTQVRVNRVQCQNRDGVVVFVKTRRIGGSVAVWFGNLFLSLTDSGICMFARSRDWMAWEEYCGHLLYPDRPPVQCGPGNTVTMPEVHGVSLRKLLNEGKRDHRAFAAAAREVRRVHQIQCDDYKAAWSHGDLHLDNILYDSASDLASLIDYDTRHVRSLSETYRHADDLKVMLLELLTLPNNEWCEPARCFLRGYGNAEILEELSRQLCIPRGLAKVFWYTRTRFCSTHEIEQRSKCLGEIIHQVVDEERTTLHQINPEPPLENSC